MMDFGMGWGWGLGWVGMALLWVVPLVLIAAAIKYLFFHEGEVPHRAADRHRSAIEQLEQRYAKGDLTRDEFLQKREDILNE